MKFVTAFCAIAAAGLVASGASAQDVKQQTTTTKTVTKVHVDNAKPMDMRHDSHMDMHQDRHMDMHHGRHKAWGHHRTCHMMWRHHHRVRVCRAMPMHTVRHTTVKTTVVTH